MKKLLFGNFLAVRALFRRFVLIRIFSFSPPKKELLLTDDTVLEKHYEDPLLVQMNLIGDGGALIFTDGLLFHFN